MSEKTASAGPKRRLFIPFWVQLFGSYMLILAIVAGLGAYTWPHVERRVFNVSRVYSAMSAAETASRFFDPSVLASIGPEVDARVADPSMRDLRRLYGAPAYSSGKRPPPPPTPEAVPAARAATMAPAGMEPGEKLDTLALDRKSVV